MRTETTVSGDLALSTGRLQSRDPCPSPRKFEKEDEHRILSGVQRSVNGTSTSHLGLDVGKVREQRRLSPTVAGWNRRVGGQRNEAHTFGVILRGRRLVVCGRFDSEFEFSFRYLTVSNFKSTSFVWVLYRAFRSVFFSRVTESLCGCGRIECASEQTHCSSTDG